MREATQASAAAEGRRQERSRTLDSPSQNHSPPNDIRMETASPISPTQSQPPLGAFERLSPIPGQPHNPMNQGIPQTSNPTIHTSIPHDFDSATHSPVAGQSYSNMTPQQFYATPPPHNFAVPLAVRTDNLSEKYGYPNGNSPTEIGPGMNMALSNPTSNPVQMNFDPNLFDQSVLSTINWLPMDLFDGSSEDMDLAPGAPPQSLPDAWSADSQQRSLWLPPASNSERISPSRISGDILQDSRNLISAQMRENMSQYARDFSESSSQAGSIESTVCSGEFYIDGDGARMPKYKRRCKTWSKSSQDRISQLALLQNDPQSPSMGFPNIEHVQIEGEPDECQPRTEISRSTYDKILEKFHQICCRSDISLFPRFDSEFFPSLNTITQFVRLYFDSFQPVYPILHIPTFDPNGCHWLLTLSLAALGCQFADFVESKKCATAMHEFVRRAIFVENELTSSKATPLWLIQATVLNCIGSLYSGQEQLKQSGLKSFNDLASSNNIERLLRHPKLLDGARQTTDWSAWIEDEARRRTGYLIWFLDCTFMYNFDHKPLLSLEDAQAPLPCHDDLWVVENEERWRYLYCKQSDVLSLNSAIQILYVEKRLVPDISEFSHTLLLHAIYQRTWEVSDYFRRPLSNWTPSARKVARDSIVPNGSLWLPGIPVFSKWRNSACDCLDVLHWAANGTIAKASGLEPPTVSHLHAGRIILLAPYKEMRTMANSISRGTVNWREHESCMEWQHIWRWAKHDQHKARLSIIHAGALLWHVRRYSTSSFHEPVLVFLATLTLWAYGHCTRTLKQLENAADKRPEPDPSAPLPSDPTFIHLDRPCDDELVQLFVREGHGMQGNVTGVGDICGPNGPERMLKVGAGILAGLLNWGLASDLNAILTRLADQMTTSPMSNHGNEL
ncbi:hypothetical protein FQN54_008404 [Arachnomyces sp. PD_36]|nr:hypothetical protein FQN54_008404 [Arachnomyces sp. PD_36]